jgi:hypothetical protein
MFITRSVWLFAGNDRNLWRPCKCKLYICAVFSITELVISLNEMEMFT